MPNPIKIELQDVIDISKVEGLMESFKSSADNSSHIELDAGQVKRIDTAGLQLLYSFQHTLNQQQGHVEIVNASQAFKECARLVGFDNILVFH